jgi:hypothetical protein
MGQEGYDYEEYDAIDQLFHARNFPTERDDQLRGAVGEQS